MTTVAYSDEQSFKITNGDVVVYQSPVLEDDAERTVQKCILKSTNNQYVLTLSDLWGDSWASGSFLEIQGSYGNTFFKNYMTNDETDVYNLSLLYFVEKASTWKFIAASADASWTNVTFDTTTWADYTGGTVSASAIGPHYFRQLFTGMDNMAAVELRLKYRYGIAAYINGKEMWRDNMGSGVITAASLSTGTYQTSDYRGVIRSAGDAQIKHCVIAVEIHFFEAGSNPVDFDGFLAVLAPSIMEEDCMAYFEIPTIIAPDATDAYQAINWSKEDWLMMTVDDSATIDISYVTKVLPLVNGIRFYPERMTSDMPIDYTLSAANPADSTTNYTTILSVTGCEYEEKIHRVDIALLSAAPASKRFRLLTTAVNNGDLNIPEMQLLVCNTAFPLSIAFKMTEVKAIINYNMVNILTRRSDLTNCTILPALPAGLNLTEHCGISGIPTELIPKTEFTITTSMYGGIKGFVYITSSTCDGMMIQVKRVYDIDAHLEGYKIRDAATNALIFSRDIDSGQTNEIEEIYHVCVTVPRISVDLSCTTSSWSPNSFLYISLYTHEFDTELLLRAKQDNRIGLPTSYIVDVTYKVKLRDAWYYKFDSIPTNWHSSSTDGFTLKNVGDFPVATGRIQLYKKSFTVASLTETATMMIGINYMYGCIIYINSREVFRNQFDGDLTAESMATQSYIELKMRYVSLPIKTLAIGTTPSVDFLTEGTNTIAIALVSITASQNATYFDCSLRLVAGNEANRIMDFGTENDGVFMSASAMSPFDMDGSSYFSNKYCQESSITVIFNGDRREWISSFSIQNDYSKNEKNVNGFIFKARNIGDEDWTTLKTVSGLTWSTAAQKRKIWVENNKSWNEYRWEKFSNTAVGCEWKMQELNLYSDNTKLIVPALVYETTIVFQNIEMSELYPNAEYYTDFTINPMLPAGLVIDPYTGILSGTAKDLQDPKVYTVHARNVIGGEGSGTVMLSVEICHGNKNLITFVLNTDSYPHENAYGLYHGRGASGSPYKYVTPLPVYSGLMYVDVCMPHGLYSFKGIDLYGDGWNANSGIRMTIDQGTLSFNMVTIPDCAQPNCNVIVDFSTILPFQINYEEWKVLTDASNSPEGWTSIAFDDKMWKTTKAAAIGTNSAITTYIRRSFTIPSLADYHVMNAHIKYAGGVVVYLNGNIVARFNMPDIYDTNTESLKLRDASKYSNFHVILTMAGATEGTNVMSFEVHRPVGSSSADAVLFDASAVFGVEDCSIVVDSYTDITGSVLYSGKQPFMFDLDVSTSLSFERISNQYISWTVENQEGSRFNNYGFVVATATSKWSFTLWGRFGEADEPTSDPGNAEMDYTQIKRNLHSNFTDRVMNQWETPVGVAGFKQFKWVQDTAPMYMSSIYSMYMKYCKASGSVCASIDNFPMVSEGQISPATCPTGYKGYMYRKCGAGGVFGNVIYDECTPKRPANLQYNVKRYQFVMSTFVTTGVPTYDNIISTFYVDEDVVLPSGLTLNNVTGEITGTPDKLSDYTMFTIFGGNSAGIVSYVITISVRIGTCSIDTIWQRTEVGVTAIYQCALQGSYIGSMKRKCVLGENDGVWEKESGVCISLLTIFLIVVVCIIVIIAVIVVLFRIQRRKVVGAVKGRRAGKTTTANKVNKKGKSKKLDNDITSKGITI